MIPGNHKIKVWDGLMKESGNLHSLMIRKKEMIIQRRGGIFFIEKEDYCVILKDSDATIVCNILQEVFLMKTFSRENRS